MGGKDIVSNHSCPHCESSVRTINGDWVEWRSIIRWLAQSSVSVIYHVSDRLKYAYWSSSVHRIWIQTFQGMRPITGRRPTSAPVVRHSSGERVPIDTPHNHAMRVIRQRFMKTIPVCIQAPALRLLALAAFRATVFKISSRLPIIFPEGGAGLKRIKKDGRSYHGKALTA